MLSKQNYCYYRVSLLRGLSMNLDKYVKTDIDDGNGHIWLKFTNDSGNDTFACSQCGYMRRVDSNNRPLNKKCVGKVKITLR